MALVKDAAERDGNALEKLLWLGNEVIDLHYRHRDYTKLSWKMRAEEAEAFSPEYVERLHHNSGEIKEKLEEIISQGIEEGLLPTGRSLLPGLHTAGAHGGDRDPVARGFAGSSICARPMQMVMQVSGLLVQNIKELAGKE